MLTLSEHGIFAGIVAVALALVSYVLAFAAIRVAEARMPVEGSGGGGATVARREPVNLIGFGMLTTWLALAFLTSAIVFRWIAVGHGPFSNMYEFSIAFAWGALVIHLYLLHRFGQWAVSLLVLPVALALLLYATSLGSTASPLVPALQNSLLLTVHVATAVVAYGAFAVAFGAAFLYAIQSGG